MLDFASVWNGRSGDYENSDCLGVSQETYCSCFAVADGKGSAKGAETVMRTIVEDFKQQTEITTATMPRFLDHAQEALVKVQETEADPKGCSAAVLLTDGSLAVWAHIGDCRVYHLQDKLLYEITPDHSEAYYRYEAGDIRYPKIRTDKTRRNLSHLMGRNQDFAPDFSPPTMVKENDSFLVCTDGFWENIHERQVEKTLKRSKTAQEWLDRMEKIVKKNRRRKKYNKKKDDYCAITVRIQG